MKNFQRIGLFLMALLFVGLVMACGEQQAGAFGALAAIGLMTSAIGVFANASTGSAGDSVGSLFVAAGVIRRLKRNVSNLAGVTRVLIYTEMQFTPDVEWPVRGTGKLLTAPPLLTTETAARVVVDIDTGKFKSTGKGPVTNKVYEHDFEGKIAGLFSEQNDGLDSVYNVPVVIVCFLQDGTRVVLGSTFKPMAIEDDLDSGAKTGDYKGTTLKAKTISSLDFRPRILDSTVVLTETTVPVYPAVL